MLQTLIRAIGVDGLNSNMGATKRPDCNSQGNVVVVANAIVVVAIVIVRVITIVVVRGVDWRRGERGGDEGANGVAGI